MSKGRRSRVMPFAQPGGRVAALTGPAESYYHRRVKISQEDLPIPLGEWSMRGPTRWLLTSAACCCLALTTSPAPAAPIPPPKARQHSYRVDFANLPPGTTLEYTLFFSAVAKDRTSTVVMRADAADMNQGQLRDLFVKLFREDGWRVMPLG